MDIILIFIFQIDAMPWFAESNLSRNGLRIKTEFLFCPQEIWAASARWFGEHECFQQPQTEEAGDSGDKQAGSTQ